ncbi:DUF2867 domain-containing protein [Nocardia goodfellowii]|uniref:DUF2867 domain-containing protein n=1 Tax=Nocardia goodfellowii TaxID=882446 RepID=A0ABS4QLT4_9NOCA|nr:DUF2867 domain-containing protein [Nocardia goodfellowii]MBP2192661.1 hypothetical protein [Nocardia goodfellowii]
MRLPKSAHSAHPWRIHDIAGDFIVEDVWAMPTPGGPDDFPELVDWFASDKSDAEPAASYRLLFALRWKLGALLGLDKPGSGVGKRVATVRDRLPADLREGPRGPDPASVPFTSVYRTDTEWVAEMANKTVHGLMHIGWVPDGAGGYRGQMAVLTKPNGLLGRLYMALILPFRYLLVYPALMSMIKRGWATRADRSGRPAT